jgi:hypothetical protein
MRTIFALTAAIALSACSGLTLPTPATSAAPAATNAQVAQKVALCIVQSGSSCPAGTAPQTCTTLAAFQCSTGY